MAHGILLSWNPPPDANATTVYNVYRSKTKGGELPGTPINSTPIAGLSYNDPTPQVGETDYYQVEAVTNGASSGPSIEASATVLPYAPLNLTATPS